MSSDRLPQVEKSLKRLRDQLHGKEDTLTTIAPEEKIRIKQQIEDLKAEIKPFETEYWQILAEQSATATIQEPEAELIVAELVEQVGQLQVSQQYPPEMIALLQQIYEQINQPGAAAAAKLKGTLSLLPPFVNVTYEAELDTEKFLQTHFPTFTKWAKALAKK